MKELHLSETGSNLSTRNDAWFIVGLSKCEWITYSSLLLVDQVTGMRFEPVTCRSRYQCANFSDTAPHNFPLWDRRQRQIWSLFSLTDLLLKSHYSEFHPSLFLEDGENESPYFLLIKMLNLNPQFIADLPAAFYCSPAFLRDYTSLANAKRSYCYPFHFLLESDTLSKKAVI